VRPTISNLIKYNPFSFAQFDSQTGIFNQVLVFSPFAEHAYLLPSKVGRVLDLVANYRDGVQPDAVLIAQNHEPKSEGGELSFHATPPRYFSGKQK